MLVPAHWLSVSEGEWSRENRDRALGLGKFAQSRGTKREAERAVKAEPLRQVVTGWLLLMPAMARLISEVVTHDSSSPNNL